MLLHDQPSSWSLFIICLLDGSTIHHLCDYDFSILFGVTLFCLIFFMKFWFVKQPANFLHQSIFWNRHYLVIPIEHIPTVKDLQQRSKDFLLGKKLSSRLLVWNLSVTLWTRYFIWLISCPYSQSHAKCGAESSAKRRTSRQEIQVFLSNAPKWSHILLYASTLTCVWFAALCADIF